MPYFIALRDLSLPQGWEIPDVTLKSAGLMTAADKVKLDSLTPGGGLPDQTGHAGQFLTTNGTTASWATVPSASNPLSLDFTTGGDNFPATLQLGNVQVGEWLRLTPTDPGQVSIFSGLLDSTPNFGGNPNDDVVFWGWFPLANGGTVIDSWESLFQGGFLQQERHIIWRSPPSLGAVETRFFSCEGHVADGSTRIFQYALEQNIGSGVNASNTPSIAINATETLLTSPSGQAGGISILLDDGSKEAILGSADVGGHYGRLTTGVGGGLGVALLDSNGVTRITWNGNLGIEVGGSYVTISETDDPNQRLQVDGNGVYSYFGNVPIQRVTAAGVGITGSVALSKGIGMWGVPAPASQFSTTGTVAGFTAGVGTAARVDSTYDGGLGGNAYTVGDLVLMGKQMGLLT